MIEIERLSKRYGETVVVDEVSMVIEEGTIAVVVGTSGAGKSTLLRMINRLIEPSSGRVLIDGQDTMAIPEDELRHRIGYVIQGYGLFPHRTVAENIATVPRLLGWDRNIRMSSPADSSSGSAWRGRLRRGPRCSSWTSPSGRLIR
jgi:osmoprotectant transport system ATP-binding protein